ncbi:tyrosine-type recombinase/integrase [Methylobacterium sp. DB0501]|uniref:tyrosine-type recombinase/integrase n=1 Tax=Methylobacterium sp. DB0501 TaxID=2709665 RepID=UPI0013ED2165|nr:tyrosine-type recombinase/integrase [Methylobacterium sp. DB0501]NGM39034.1 tyrosine-type recombinase/integrase [Methylobacterium sp. DB0501]
MLVATSGGVLAHPEDLAALAERARAFAEGSRSAATRRAYSADLAHFTDWCAAVGLASLPAEPYTVAAYITAFADRLATATLGRRMSAIAVAHRAAGYVMDLRHPAVRDTWQGIRRAKGTAQRHAEALTTPILKQVLATCSGGRLIDLRDRSLLLTGFGGALRRAELCALDLADVAVLPQGLKLRLARSKGDQEGQGEFVPVGRTGSAFCPAAAFEAWVAAAGISAGRAYRSVDRHGRVGTGLSTRAVAQIVQSRAELAGLDPTAFSGHSMRSGFCTSAAAEGVEERVIMRQSRHKSASTVRRYIQDGDLWAHSLTKKVGL